DRLAQLGGEASLCLDALEDGLLAVVQLAEEADAGLDLADHVFVEPAGPLLAIASDERDGIAVIEQLHHTLDLDLFDLQVLRDPRAFQRSDVVHGSFASVRPDAVSGGSARQPGASRSIGRSFPRR